MSIGSRIKKFFSKKSRPQLPPDNVQWTPPLDLGSNQMALNMMNEENKGRDMGEMYGEILGRGLSAEETAAPFAEAPVEEAAPAEEAAPIEEAVLEEAAQEETAPAEEVEVEPTPDETTAVPDEELGAGLSNSNKKKSTDAAVRLKGHSDTLKETKKWGGNDDSDSYKAVMSKVDKTMNGVTSADALNDDMYASTKTLIRSMKDYKEIIEACDVYIAGHPKPRSIPGKSRKKAILRIKEQAMKDMQGLRDYSDTMSTLDETERAGSIRDVLTRSRRRVIRLKKKEDGTDVRETDMKHVGGAASRLAVIQKGDLTDENASGFFKQDEDYAINDKYDWLAFVERARIAAGMKKNDPIYKHLMKGMRAYFKTVKPGEELYDDHIGRYTFYLDTKEKYEGDPKFEMFDQAIGRFRENQTTLSGNIKTLGIATNRNVMTINKGDYIDPFKGDEEALPVAEEIFGLINTGIDQMMNLDEIFDKLVRKDSRYQSDPYFKEIAERMYEYQRMNSQGLTDMEKVTNDRVNMSGRNVASSRIAALLGYGDLIAQSETAELVDSDGNFSQTGNFMQGAKGSELKGLMASRYKDEYDAQIEDLYNKKVARINSNEKLSEEQKAKTISQIDKHSDSSLVKFKGLGKDDVTTDFLKSMSSLQVFDNLTGQVDRHWGNIFVDQKDGKLGKVMGIDNDLSFGNTSLLGDIDGNIGLNGRSIASTGEMTLPYMEERMATAIENLDEGEARLMLEDVLEDWAINAFLKRLAQMKELIRNTREQQNAEGGKKRILSDDEWTTDMYQEFIDQKAASKVIMGRTSTKNYVSVLDNYIVGSGVSSEIKSQYNEEEKKRKKQAAGK